MSREAESESERILSAARRLEPHDVYLLFSHEAHFCNPLVPAEWAALAGSPALADPQIRGPIVEVVERWFVDRVEEVPRGLYFPAPIARQWSSDVSESEIERLLDRFHYEMIQVDGDQVWRWRGEQVAERTRRFFLELLRWEPAIERFYFEYKIHDGWWDKSYLDVEVTPLVAQRWIEDTAAPEEGEDRVEVVMASGQQDSLRLDTFRLDDRERLFCRTSSTGEVLFSDVLRFQLLRHATHDLSTLVVAGKPRPLQWPASSSAR